MNALVSTTACRLIVVASLLAARPAFAEKMTFHWPVPAKVTVTDRNTSGGVTATVRYEVTLAPQGKEGGLALRFGKFEFLDIAGRDARDPAIRKQLRGVREVASALPTVLISPQGAFVDVADLETTIDRILRSSEVPAKERREMAKLLKSPAMVASVKSRAVEFWNVWVGLWAGADLEPGRSREITVRTAMPNGALVERPVRVAHQGPDGPPGYVHLSFESTLDGGGKQTAALKSAARDLAGSAAKDVPDDIEGFRLSLAGEVITDPATLKPAHARSLRRTAVKLKGQPPRTEEEIHEYSFDWKPRPQGK